MRIIFAGTPEFAAVALKALITAGHEIPLVLTQPDRPAGRGMQYQPSAVKQLALSHNLPVFQPHSLRKDPEPEKILRAQQADLMVVAAYGLILPQTILEIPPLGCLNIHASLLPRWRGAAPIQRAIQSGDQETGICIMQMEAGLDTGPVLARAHTPILPDDTAASLHDRLAALGAELLIQTLGNPLDNAEPQAETGVSYASKIEKSEALIDWQLDAETLDRQIRAFNPFPVAQTLWNSQPLKIWKAHPTAGSGTPGTLLSCDRNGLIVACGKGALQITELQKAGGKRLGAAQFLAGNSIKPKECFGSET